MAEKPDEVAPQQDVKFQLDWDEFCCCVCLDLLREPITIPCGHTYCKGCLEGYWEGKEEFKCPQCRETFWPRPVLRRTNMVAQVVVKMRSSTMRPPLPAASVACAGPEDVPCDFCRSSRPDKAVMSCLTCLASYCPAHLQPHYSVLVLVGHQLVSATTPLKDRMCRKHNKPMEVYCRTDKQCVCYMCVADGHKWHQTVSAAAQRVEEQNLLTVNQKKVQERAKEREKELAQLITALTQFKICGQTEAEASELLFEKLILSIRNKCTLTRQLMKAREQRAVAQAEQLQLQLEEEIARLRRRDAELQILSHTNDNIHFLKMFQSLSSSCESPDLPSAPHVLPELSFKAVTDCVSQLGLNMESLLQDTWPSIPATVSLIDVVLPPVPKTINQFLRYVCPLTLDSNSVHRSLSLSKGLQRVTSAVYDNCHSAHTDRFSAARQVLCREGLSERCYWEVGGSWATLTVAVSYKSISRTSPRDSEFGKNNKSWSLECSTNGYTFHHDKRSVPVSGPKSDRIAVYLDYKAGTLSFYSISDTMNLLHKVQSKFTQPLFPGLGLKNEGYMAGTGQHAELLKLNRCY